MLMGTVVRMRKNDLFITQAMLASYLSVEHKSYLELIEPFILKCLPVTIGMEVNVSDLQKQVNNEYNLDILYHVVEKILQRLSKRKRGEYIKRNNNSYFINKTYDDTNFDNKKNQIKSSLEQVILCLKDFLINEKKINNINENIVKEYLCTFLDTYNYSIYEDVESAHSITISDLHSNTNYYVAQFILNEYNKKSVVYNNILEVIKGTLVAKSIYYFMYEENNDYGKKIIGTKFYLDTRLLIGILGLNSEQENNAMQEMLVLIKKSGGKLVTFRHYLDELQGILYKYAKDVSSRLSLSLQRFSATNATSVDVEMYSKTVETRLQQLGIAIEELPDYEELVQKKQWHIDYAELRNELDNNINYKTNFNSYFSEALENDCKTIEAIAFFRKFHSKYSIYNCKAIFVTKNRDIVSVVNNLYKKERFSKGEINFAITDVDLTAMLWLGTFGGKNDLPQLKLLEDVYAACAPSNHVMKAFLNKIKSLEDNDKISQEMAILLRTDYSMLCDLTELTDNNSGKVTDETVYEMQARILNRETKKARQNLQQEYEVVEQERKINRQEGTAIEARRNDLIQLQRRAFKDKEDAKVIEARVEKQRIKNEMESRNNAIILEKIDKLKRKLVIDAKNKAKRHSNIVKIGLNVVCILLCIIAVVVFSYATYKVTDFTNQSTVVSCCIVCIVSIIGFVSSILSFKMFLSKRISSFCMKIYDHMYSKELNKNKDFFE